MFVSSLQHLRQGGIQDWWTLNEVVTKINLDTTPLWKYQTFTAIIRQQNTEKIH